jgi:hypothetical protein
MKLAEIPFQTPPPAKRTIHEAARAVTDPDAARTSGSSKIDLAHMFMFVPNDIIAVFGSKEINDAIGFSQLNLEVLTLENEASKLAYGVGRKLLTTNTAAQQIGPTSRVFPFMGTQTGHQLLNQSLPMSILEDQASDFFIKQPMSRLMDSMLSTHPFLAKIVTCAGYIAFDFVKERMHIYWREFQP